MSILQRTKNVKPTLKEPAYNGHPPEMLYSPCKRTTEKNQWNLPRRSILDPYYESNNFSLNCNLELN